MITVPFGRSMFSVTVLFYNKLYVIFVVIQCHINITLSQLSALALCLQCVQVLSDSGCRLKSHKINLQILILYLKNVFGEMF